MLSKRSLIKDYLPLTKAVMTNNAEAVMKELLNIKKKTWRTIIVKSQLIELLFISLLKTLENSFRKISTSQS